MKAIIASTQARLETAAPRKTKAELQADLKVLTDKKSDLAKEERRRCGSMAGGMKPGYAKIGKEIAERRSKLEDKIKAMKERIAKAK
jgi:hypothetical protein